ncbi:MAG: hypothetical protein IPI01_07465 [Ignavibacteriae bacterium]|nr:hypothetical protein [Ignavibacteriota bacterium]
MSSGATSSQQGLAAEQVYEIQAMAEGGQFADALIRLRKIKAHYPQTTFFVALEKQLERLLVLPRDTDPSEAQKKELLDSLPGLIQGAVQAVRSGVPAKPVPPPPAPPRPAPDRVDREAARTQLKEQYFQHADEYLKKGAYGSALVEIRRVKIIAPDDKTALEYERTIRQLVELQQRAGIAGAAEEAAAPPVPAPRVEERIIEVTASDTAWVAAPSIPAPPAHASALSAATGETCGVLETAGAAREHKGGKKWWLFAVLLAALVGGTGLVTILSAADESAPSLQVEAQQSSPEDPQHQASVEASPATGDAETASTPLQEASTMVAPEAQGPEPVQESVSVPAVQPQSVTASKTVEAPVQTAAAVAGQQPTVEPVIADRDPRIVELVQPVFTSEQQSMPSGDVVVMVQIGLDGKPAKTMIAKSTNPAFNQPIVTAVLRSTFSPGTTASAPAVKWLTIPFRVN